MADFKFVDIKLIDPPAQEMRIDLNAKDFKELCESISKNGILQPLLLRPRGERFEIIAGVRRFRAAQALGLSEVPAMARDATDSEAIIYRMHENLVREDTDPVSEALFIVRSMRDLEWKTEEFAEMLGRSVKYVEDRLRISEMPDYLMDFLKNKEISLGVALALDEIDDDRVKRDWAYAAVRDGMTVSGAKNALSHYKKMKSQASYEPVKQGQPIAPVELPEEVYQCARCGKESSVSDLHFVRVHLVACPTS